MGGLGAMETREDGSGVTGIEHPRVGLFVTCLVDLFRPEIGRAHV